MKVKICGIMDVETALKTVEFGADALGFVFAESKRKITPDQAKEIINEIPDGILKVGVFVNEDPDVIREIVKETGINVIQLHGDESPEYCGQFSVPVIKALSVESQEDLKQLDQYSCDYYLLDSPKGKYRGGNGVTFDWSILNGEKLNGKKVILAGGLSIDNVEQAIELTAPYMVDVSSGVETDGKKDIQKIKEFIDQAKKGQKSSVLADKL
ncbi:phosphoribosylanthranilate isomerase [Bacillus sp. DTU_2020_1000418_1_SI_GHA_SEK_038]|uniref:phosphoribosylanthranilate isomerase n=1 Tax=Bacillus sp. DTU_2020_1000418_1_SI_GHA_SEK_038 TaxID=3077585 RepID=UPI0028EE644D|nr:phosphoribosylanthranilate isomerase [Bacillus sp. DTU_2020_1000418_1_SI_GHA_SEK_038]WNS73803.1 phosphoribosylanthranilate isomerase [Bacillus sp. DTU_2020_1000418_1_SI_GHA_SEK_038]